MILIKYHIFGSLPISSSLSHNYCSLFPFVYVCVLGHAEGAPLFCSKCCHDKRQQMSLGTIPIRQRFSEKLIAAFVLVRRRSAHVLLVTFFVPPNVISTYVRR
jgi:hypothetical protein